MSVTYGYVRSRQLEGTFPGSPSTGVWISTWMRVMKGWRSVEEKLWPYDGDGNRWPPTEPEGLDLHAKAHRIHVYQRVSTVDEYRFLLSSKIPGVAAFEIDDSWGETPKGLIPEPSGQTITGTHSVGLVGHNDYTKRFKIRNSWGTAWGDAGYGYLPYSYFPERFVEGWTITAIPGPPSRRYSGQTQLSIWGVKDLFGYAIHGREVVDSARDEMLGWGFAVERESSLWLEELFVRPNWRRRGYASELAAEFIQLSGRLGKPLYAWIPHPDAGKPNRRALKAMLRRLGLSRKRSPVRWAGAIGV